MDWDAVRREFPALAHWTYLNTATFGQLPRRATEAVARHFAHRDELACGDFLAWYDDADRIRAKIGRLINCAPEDIAFVPNASTALGLLLAGLDWHPGDRVLTLEHEFPNNLYAPGLLERFGVETTACPWDRFYESVNARTRLAILSSVNYNTGFAPPLAEMAEFLARARHPAVYRRNPERRRAALRYRAAFNRTCWRCTDTNGCSRPTARDSSTLLRNCASGFSPTWSAGAAIATGATSTTCITEFPNCRPAPRSTKAGRCPSRCCTPWRLRSI